MSNKLREGEKELVEELLILNSIVYTEDFSKETILDYDNIYEWAVDFDVSSIKDNYPAEINEKEFATIIETIKRNKDVYSKMEIADVTTYKANNVTGGKGVNATIKYEESYIVVYKGTAGAIDWKDNEEGGYSRVSDTKQQIAAAEYFERIMDIKPSYIDTVYVTGHSKGGNKAQYVGVRFGEMIDHVYAFDGQNFNDTFKLKYHYEIEKNKHKITNISNEYDFVNILLERVSGRTIFVKSNTSFGNKWNIKAALKHKFGGWHSPYSMLSPTYSLISTEQNPFGELKGTELHLNAETEQSKLMQDLEAYLDYLYFYMDEKDWRYLSNTLMAQMMNDREKEYYKDQRVKKPEGFEERLAGLSKGYFETNTDMELEEIMVFMMILLRDFRVSSYLYGGVIGIKFGNKWLLPIEKQINELYKLYERVPPESYALVTRDFTEETRQKLLSIVEEVENEKWFNITRWDVFYRIEKYFGGLDFPANESELDTYYRKIIDIEDTSKKQINEIFEQVYAADNSFSNELKSLVDNVRSINYDLKKISNRFK